jgi:hypothetical protein
VKHLSCPRMNGHMTSGPARISGHTAGARTRMNGHTSCPEHKSGRGSTAFPCMSPLAKAR